MIHPDNKPRRTEPKLDVLYRYYRGDKETTKNEYDSALDYRSKNEGCVVLSNETSKGAKAAAIRSWLE
jgi:hypothetical protein